MTGDRTSDGSVASAEAAHAEAAAAFATASDAYEAALQRHDEIARKAAHERLREASDEVSRTLSALVEARRATVPSFEVLLTDPTIQPDPDSVVLKSMLASIEAYRAAKPASAGRPLPER